MYYIGKLNKEKIGKYKSKISTEDVVLTFERLNEHILVFHANEYEQLKKYLKDIIERPDIIIEDNRNIDTLIFLKNLQNIDKKGRIIVKLASKQDEKHPKNSIITLMELNERTWKQTIKNRGTIIYEKDIDKSE